MWTPPSRPRSWHPERRPKWPFSDPYRIVSLCVTAVNTGVGSPRCTPVSAAGPRVRLRADCQVGKVRVGWIGCVVVRTGSPRGGSSWLGGDAFIEGVLFEPAPEAVGERGDVDGVIDRDVADGAAIERGRDVGLV